MTSKTSETKTLRRIAHHLDSVVLIGDSGISDGVIAETARALEDHELIKVRITGEDRQVRVAQGDQLAQACGANIVQRIGKVVVLFKPNPKANPKLSNLHRYSGGA